MEIITIVGDSLSMCRSDNEAFYSYRDTYPFKLEMLLDPSKYHVALRSRGRNNVMTQDLPEYLEGDILFNDSRYIIFHLGIVDCAPRLFTLTQDRILFLLGREPVIKIFANALIKFKQKYRRFFTRYFPKTNVSREEFKEKYSHILQKIREVAKPQKVFLINIAETSDKNNFRSFNFKKNISDYNKIIDELVLKNQDLCELVDFFSATKEHKGFIIKDEGIHLTKEGQSYLAQALCEKIKKEDEKNI